MNAFASTLPEKDTMLAIRTATQSGKPGLARCFALSREALLDRNEGLTLLHHAYRSGVLEIVDYLFGAGADVNVESPDEGATPLHMACMFCYVSSLDFYAIFKDLNLNAKDRLGQIPLVYGRKW